MPLRSTERPPIQELVTYRLEGDDVTIRVGAVRRDRRPLVALSGSGPIERVQQGGRGQTGRVGGCLGARSSPMRLEIAEA